jgi:hypothetical protein
VRGSLQALAPYLPHGIGIGTQAHDKVYLETVGCIILAACWVVTVSGHCGARPRSAVRAWLFVCTPCREILFILQ